MMSKRLFSWFFVLGVVFYSCNPVFAKTTEEKIAELKAKLVQQEQRIVELESKLVQREPASTSIQLKDTRIWINI